jgi:hypothetical protein
MQQPLKMQLRISMLIMAAIFFFSPVHAQPNQANSRIDWSKDTISSTRAYNAQREYTKALNGAGKRATSTITLPVDKMKEIMDACAANGITSVKVMLIALRPEDIQHYSDQNPGLTPADKATLLGQQMIVFRVPRSAFPYSAGSKAQTPMNSPLMVSLMAMGLVPLPDGFSGQTPGTADVYLTLGIICPPPAACD